MKICTILPLTDSFSNNTAGAASLFIKDIDLDNKNITVIGSTDENNYIFKKKYINIKNINKLPKGKNYNYAIQIIKIINRKKFDIIEIHNRPQIADILFENLKDLKIILFFHNDPNSLRGSSSPKEKLELLKKCSKIVFLSEWIKDQFFKDIKFKNSSKTIVIYPVIQSKKNNYKLKEKTVCFAGKLNSSKGYDTFCDVAKKFLTKNKEWKFIVIGDEPREKINFEHPNFFKYGWLPHDEVIKLFKKSSIIITPSKWDEPLGRVPIEASKSGSVVITYNKGGLIESAPYAFIDRTETSKGILEILNHLTKDNKERREICTLNNKYNYHRTNKLFVKNKLLSIRKQIISKKIYLNFKNPIKVLHVADLHLRHNARLYYSTVKKINNGLIRNNYNVQTFSDRDVQSYNKNFTDPKGINALNQSFIDCINNFRADIIIFGHADNISRDSLEVIKNNYTGTKISQWFLDPLIKNGPDYEKNLKRLKLKFDYCDANFVTTDPKKVSLFKNKLHYLPNPVDQTIDYLEIYKNEDPIYDLFIAISHGQHRATLKSGKTDERINFINKITDSKIIKTNLFGHKKQPVWGDHFFYELQKCSMALNISRGEPINLYSSDRIASLMGNGILTFIDERYGFKKFFNKNEVVFYNNINDLYDKIIFYKKNQKLRKLIAKNGKKKYFKLFNNVNVSKYIVEKTVGINTKLNW